VCANDDAVKTVQLSLVSLDWQLRRSASRETLVDVTERLARACSRHPWRTIGAWIAALVLALAAIGLLLPGNLTSNGGAAGNPEFRQAERIEFSAFPYNPRLNFSDIVLVRSSRYNVDEPAFRNFVSQLVRKGQATG